jgi:hypothetical protein
MSVFSLGKKERRQEGRKEEKKEATYLPEIEASISP